LLLGAAFDVDNSDTLVVSVQRVRTGHQKKSGR
jgi:hypothetical protein